MLLNVTEIVSESVPPGEFVHNGQGSAAFITGCLMGGLDPNRFLSFLPGQTQFIRKARLCVPW